MGGGSFDRELYRSATNTRAVKGVADFAYTDSIQKGEVKAQVHQTLDPRRINKKPFPKLESRDSSEHPNSNAVFVAFDVTGSNRARAVDAQKKLPKLMDLLEKYLSDPQVLVAANDDYTVVGTDALQISEYESDNRIDDHIRNTWLVGNGGGNDGESYDLILYAAARKTALDCFEKRDRKGYFFMYADEPIFQKVRAREVRDVFGDEIPGDIKIEDIIEEVQRFYHVFVLWPTGGYDSAREQYVKLFGEDSVFTLQSGSMICELIGSLVGMNEDKITDLEGDLVGVGASKADISLIERSVKKFKRKITLPKD